MKVWFGDEVKRPLLGRPAARQRVAVAGDPAAPAVPGPGAPPLGHFPGRHFPGRRCLALGRCRVQLRGRAFRFLAHHCQARLRPSRPYWLPGAAGGVGRRARLGVEIKGYHYHNTVRRIPAATMSQHH